MGRRKAKRQVHRFRLGDTPWGGISDGALSWRGKMPERIE
jgi:hypothetical protein